MQPSNDRRLDRQQLDAAITAATDVREHAHAPYSRFLVGAALMDNQGRLFVGCNVENASYGLTICAERNAMAHAVASGSRRIVAVVIVTDAAEPTPPCGACRQVLKELNDDMVIISHTLQGKEASYLLSELLPHAFTKSQL